MADDLRQIVAALRIASDLERIGDLAKNIAKRVDRAERRVPRRSSSLTGLQHMAELALEQLKDVLDAYAAARRRRPRMDVWRRDERDRRDLQLAVPRAADLHDGRPAQHHASARISCSAPRTSSASATTPPISPRRSTTS